MKPLRIQILTFTLIRIVLNTAQRMVYPYMTVFGQGLGVDLAMLSRAIAGRSLLGTTGPFLASIADNRGRKLGMLLGVLIFFIGAILVLGWPVYPVFVLTLALTLLGKYVFDPAMQAYVGEKIPYQRRGFILAITEFGWSLSFILGVPLMGFLIARFGWLGPYPALALLGLLSMGSLAWLLPKDPSPASDPPSILRNLRSVLTFVPALAGLATGAFTSTANEVVNVVFGVWMEDSFGLKIAGLAVTAAVIGFSELGGEGLSAGLADRLGKPRAVGIGLVANCLAAVALPVLGSSLLGALFGLFCFYITFEFTIVSSISMMSEVVPTARASLMATNAASHSLGRVLGALLAPLLYSLGFWGSCLAAVAFNLIAFLALMKLNQWHGHVLR